MKKIFISILICVIFSGMLCACAKKEEAVLISNTYVALTDQENNRLAVFDISKGVLDDTSLVWSYQVENRGISDAKLRYSEKYGDVVVINTGDNYACMVTYPEGKLVWSTKIAADNPHAVELLPNGYIAIASSSGNEVRIFDTTKDTDDFEDYLNLLDSHGVIWDDKRQLLWAIGKQELVSYSFEVEDGTLYSTQEQSVTLPTKGGHDLTVDYANEDALLLTTGSGMYRFNIETSEFTELFTDNEEIPKRSIKGIGSFSDGTVIYIKPDGEYKVWTSKTLSIVQNGQVSHLTSPIGHYYKCRVWSKKYR